MEFIPEAHAQAAEAAKVAVDAGGILLQYQVLGAACVFLLLALGVVFWLLIQSYKDKATLLERIITAAEQSKTSAEDNADATKGLATALAGLTQAVQALAREAEGEAREARHGIGQLAQIVSGNADMIRATRDQMAANGEVLRDLRGFMSRGRE